MNEQILDTLANVGITLAAFSGVVVAFRAGGAGAWSRGEVRVLTFLVIDAFLVTLFALLPFPLALADLPADLLWGVCSALLGSWFVVGFVVAMVAELRDRKRGERRVTIPIVTPILYATGVLGLLAGIVLWLSAFDVVPRGQTVYVAGLLALLALAAVEFLFLIALTARRNTGGPTLPPS